MHINKYLLGVSSVVIIGSIGWLSAGALTISNSNFAKGFPIFKTIFFRSEGKDSINGSTNPEGVRLDNSGIYTAVPNGLPGGGGNVLKLNGGRQIYMDPVQNGNLVNDSISSIKITNNSIINSNFADLAITNSQIKNNSIEITKFDPGIIWPTGGTMFITNNVCTSTNAIISVNNGTATCALLPTGATTLPTCSAGQQPVFSGGVWTCVTFNIGAGSGDPYRTGLTVSAVPSSIASSNVGNVGIGTSSPASKLTVSGSLEILGTTEDQVYCYATDTWVPLSAYNAGACAGCNAGYNYNSTTQLCEQSSCVSTGPTLINGQCGSANGGTFAIAPTANLCNAGTTGAVGGTGPWSWTCYGTGGGTDASCSANITSNPTCGGYAGPIYVRRTLVNNQYSSQNSDPLCGGRPNGQHADLWDCQYDFYSDAAGTVPVSVTNLIVNTNTAINCNYGSCIGGGAGSFVANGFSSTQTNCDTDYIEDFPPGGCGAWYATETTMTNSSCAEEVTGGPSIAINAFVIGGGHDGRITMIAARGMNVSAINGAFPISAGQSVDAAAGNGTTTLDVNTDGDPSGGMGQGSVRVADTAGNNYCQNYAGAGTYNFPNVVINSALGTVNVTLDPMTCSTPPPGGDIHIINNLNLGNQINSVTQGGFQFYLISAGAFPITTPIAPNNEVVGDHGGLGNNEMDIDLNNGGDEWCIYTFINNPPTPGNCNPVGFTQQTQGAIGQTNGMIYHPAFGANDRVDVLVCDGTCN